MANERFDKKIKEKLESVNRPIGENVWGNIRKRIHLPWYLDFWQRFGWPLYSGLATLMLFWSIKDKYDYEKQFSLLNDKISTIEQIKTKTQVQEIVHRDTVYISKTIYVVQKEAQPAKQPSQYERQADAGMALKNIYNEVPVITAQQENAGEQPLSKMPDAKLSDSAEKPEETAYNKPGLIPDRHIPAEAAPAQSSKIRWPRMDTRMGLNTGIGFNHTIDLGPVFEIFMGKSMSLTTGVTFLTNPETEYDNPRDFNQETRQNFINLYKNYLPERYERLEDIRVRASMLSIPLNVNYYFPLNRKLDLKFSAGTNINLRMYQNVQFESHIDGDENFSSFNTAQKKGLWYSFLLSTGLQYRHNRYAFQLVPTYIYHFRETDFLSPRNNFRVNGSVLINLKRDR